MNNKKEIMNCSGVEHFTSIIENTDLCKKVQAIDTKCIPVIKEVIKENKVDDFKLTISTANNHIAIEKILSVLIAGFQVLNYSEDECITLLEGIASIPEDSNVTGIDKEIMKYRNKVKILELIKKISDKIK
jgi:hypothetical protein